ncbi:phosphodiesterase [Micromonospora sp. NPDC048930]|uniref:phosphodiesterase n=1 Tax=Micromonospora sp. NPDC048930 TaxID=3364261 RepID=UPI00371F1999
MPSPISAARRLQAAAWRQARRAATAAAVGAASALARRRHARLLHPAGRTFSAELTIWGTPGPPTGVPLLDRPGRWPATVRLSKGVPTPGSWPDVLGVGIRLHRDPETPVDLLVSSSGAAPVLRNLPLPRRRFTGTYTSIMSFRAGRRRLFLAALADPDSPELGRGLAELEARVEADAPRLVLAVASAVGAWRPFGQVTLDGGRDAREDAALAFDPLGNVPPGLRMVGPLAWLRETTYRGSRRGRGAGVQSGGSAGVTV